MGNTIYYAILFLAKMLDNGFGTAKTMLVQRNRWILAGTTVILSDFIYFWITKMVVSSSGWQTMLVVSLAGGMGCSLACLIGEKASRDRTYISVVMSDNLQAMKKLRDFLAEKYVEILPRSTLGKKNGMGYNTAWRKHTKGDTLWLLLLPLLPLLLSVL